MNSFIRVHNLYRYFPRFRSMTSHSTTTRLNILVEGNIGSGKTTLLDYLNNQTNYHIEPEPLEKWRDVNGNNLLRLWYNDKATWSFSFQMYVLLTMLENHNINSTNDIKIMERSIYSAKYCFIEALKNSNTLHMVEFNILEQWYDYILKEHEPKVELIIYVRTSPGVCFERMKARSRNEETSVDFKYIEQLHKLHEQWLLSTNRFKVVIIDGNLCQNDIVSEYRRVMDIINEL